MHTCWSEEIESPAQRIAHARFANFHMGTGFSLESRCLLTFFRVERGENVFLRFTGSVFLFNIIFNILLNLFHGMNFFKMWIVIHRHLFFWIFTERFKKYFVKKWTNRVFTGSFLSVKNVSLQESLQFRKKEQKNTLLLLKKILIVSNTLIRINPIRINNPGLILCYWINPRT